jgi:hypothetical protein
VIQERRKMKTKESKIIDILTKYFVAKGDGIQITPYFLATKELFQLFSDKRDPVYEAIKRAGKVTRLSFKGHPTILDKTDKEIIMGFAKYVDEHGDGETAEDYIKPYLKSIGKGNK